MLVVEITALLLMAGVSITGSACFEEVAVLFPYGETVFVRLNQKLVLISGDETLDTNDLWLR